MQTISPRTLRPCARPPGKILEVRFVVGYTPLAFRDTLHLLADERIDPGPLRVAKVPIDPSSLATEPRAAAG